MDENLPEGPSGISRRNLLKRGAIAGGTLMWAAPVITSMASPAYAASGKSPGTCAACYCFNGSKSNPSPSATSLTGDECSDNGVQGFRVTGDACREYCTHTGAFAGGGGAPGGPYEKSEYCSGVTSCVCNSANDPGSNGVSCS